MRWFLVAAVVVILVSPLCANVDERGSSFGTRFTLACAISVADDAGSAVPVEVLEAIAASEWMRGVKFHSGGGSSRLQAEFVFAELADFTEWYRSEAAMELLKTLRSVSAEPLEMKLEATATHPDDEYDDDDDDEH